MEEIDDITIERAARGNAVAFRHLYAHYSPFVWRICYRACNSEPAPAEEIMQNSFVKVYRYLSSFAKGAAFSTWLYKITYNCINEYFAKQVKMQVRTVVLSDEDVDSYIVNKDKENRVTTGITGKQQEQADFVPYEDEQVVEKVLSTLSEEDRFIMTAREIDGFSFKDLADITGIAEGALRVRVTRLKSHIREQVPKLKFWTEIHGQ